MNIKELKTKIEEYKPRSAFEKGAKGYALEMLENICLNNIKSKMNEKLKDNISYNVTAFDANGKILNHNFNSGYSNVSDCFYSVKSEKYTIRELHISSEESFFICVKFNEDEKEIQYPEVFENMPVENLNLGELLNDVKGNRIKIGMFCSKDASQLCKDASWNGNFEIYDMDIAERLCTKSELKKKEHGIKEPYKNGSWLDVQGRAIWSAIMMIQRLGRN